MSRCLGHGPTSSQQLTATGKWIGLGLCTFMACLSEHCDPAKEEARF